MRMTIDSPAELGLVLRAVRRAAGVRIDDAAASTGVSKQFASDVERGKATVQLGKVLQLLRELGVVLEVDIPSGAVATLEALRERGVRPVRPRAPRGALARAK